MSKPRKKLQPVGRENPIQATVPWSCTHFGSQSEIETHVAATGKWETLAEVHAVAGIDAEEIADFIVHVVNKHQKTCALLKEMSLALKGCGDGKGITLKAKQNITALLEQVEGIM